MSSPPDIEWTQIEQERDVLLEQVRPNLDALDFVVLRATMHKLVGDAKAREQAYEQSLLDGTDPFVKDVSNPDPLAFILRGTLQIEELIVKVLSTFNLTPRSTKLHARINALQGVAYISDGERALLHEIRELRNGVSHELESGRSVDPQVALTAYNKLDAETKADLESLVGHDPIQLPPDVLVKLLLNRGYRVVEGALSHHEMQQQLKKALRIS